MDASKSTGKPQKPTTPKPSQRYRQGFFAGASTVVLAMTAAIWVIVLIVGPPNYSVTQIPGTPVHDARISHSLAIAQAYWAAHGRSHNCKGGAMVVLVTSPSRLKAMNQDNLAAETNIYGCTLELNPETYYNYSWGDFCKVIVHEYGHTVGLNDNHDPNSLMYGGGWPKPIPSGCQHSGDSRRYLPPVDTPAATCLFLIDQRLPGWGYGRVQHCGKVVNLTVPHAAIAGSQPAACLDVETAAPAPPEWTFKYNDGYTIANPRGCHHLQVDVVAAGRPETKHNQEHPIDFHEGTNYNRPYLE